MTIHDKMQEGTDYMRGHFDRLAGKERSRGDLMNIHYNEGYYDFPTFFETIVQNEKSELVEKVKDNNNNN